MYNHYKHNGKNREITKSLRRISFSNAGNFCCFHGNAQSTEMSM